MSSRPKRPSLSPPITFVDEGGDVGPLFATTEDLATYLEWPDQFDEPAEAYDAIGRHLILALDPDGWLEVSIGLSLEPEGLEARLREVVSDRTIRFGLLDADVDLDVLLRAIWRWQSGKRPYPGGWHWRSLCDDRASALADGAQLFTKEW